MTSNSDLARPKSELATAVHSLGIDRLERHLFLCADQTKPKCCSREEGLAAWDYLKGRLQELGLDQPTAERPTCVFRTKANCLRVCSDGPLLLVYPDGIWYHHATPEVIERILQEHILGDRPVAEYIFYHQPLGNYEG